MPQFDLPLDVLQSFRMTEPEPDDFDDFWRRTLADAEQHPLAATHQRICTPYLRLVEAYDASFAGYGGQRIRAWALQPAGNAGKLPCLVTFVGYGGGRSLPVDHLAPAVAGMAHFVMDTRGQGAAWSPGDTPDDGPAGPAHPGFMTRGIDSRETYYYRRLMVDAARAVDAAGALPFVDPPRIAVSGASQGGGLAIAAAALRCDRVKLLIADVPFLCAFRRAMQLVDTRPYGEISAYLAVHRGRVEDVFRTLAYFDAVNFAPRVAARSLFSAALMDTTCPPSTVFAAYNRIAAPKQIRTYEYNNHEGGGVFQLDEKLRFLLAHL